MEELKMKLKQSISVIFFFLLFFGCSPEHEDKKVLIYNKDKVFYVIFNDKLEITTNDIYSNGFRIGEILSQELDDNNDVVTKISINGDYKKLMKSNTIFYVSDGVLEYDTVGDEGKLIKEGSKLLGFNGKSSMYLYKARNKSEQLFEKVKTEGGEFFEKAKSKAEDIYEKATK